MVSLVDWQIREKIGSKEIKIVPYDPELINPQSIDIRLGDKFGEVSPRNLMMDGKTLYLDPLNPNSFETKVKTSGVWYLSAKTGVIATTLEAVVLPSNVIATVKGKSSLGRLFIGNSHVAGHIDGGFAADGITLEIFNYNDFTVKLTAGMKIGQLVLEQTETPEKDYSKTGRYQGQKSGSGSLGI